MPGSATLGSLACLGGVRDQHGSFCYAGILPTIATDMGISVSAAGQLVTAYALTYAVGSMTVMSTHLPSLKMETSRLAAEQDDERTTLFKEYPITVKADLDRQLLRGAARLKAILEDALGGS